MIYSTLIFILDVYLRIYGIFSPKIAQWNFERSKQKAERKRRKNNNHALIGRSVVWMHCASLGEFEQGRVILDKIKKEDPSIYFLLSFFSPSGYEVKKYYELADEVVYLPLDFNAEMGSFIDYYSPAVFIGVKYEWWWNLFSQLNKRNIPKVLIALKPKPSSYIFKNSFTNFRRTLTTNSFLYCQDQATFDIFNKLSDRTFLSGDPRVESVISRKSQSKQDFEALIKPINNRKVMIYGSIYESDMKVISKSIEALNDYYHIIVPHDVSKGNCHAIASYFKGKVQYWSVFEDGKGSNKILIDQIGLLFDLYRLADIAYIGGGFGKSVHNTLEPAVFGLPIAIGPNFKGFAEIEYLLKHDAIFVISVKEDFDRFIEISNVTKRRSEIVASQQAYFGMNEGVCNEIVKMVVDLVNKSKV